MNGNTPLQTAMNGRNPVPMAALLIRHGVNVNIKDEHGTAPLHLAIYEGNGELAKLLIEAGADAQSRTDASNAPVQVAASAGVPGASGAATFFEQVGCPESLNR